jgi:hypothetical protein
VWQLAEVAQVLRTAHQQLQPDALVAGKQWQEAVRGRGGDQLEAPRLGVATELGDEIAIDRLPDPLQFLDVLLPPGHHG